MRKRVVVAGSFLLAAAASAPAQVFERFSVSSSGAQGNDASYAGRATSDGRWALFASSATNLVAGDTNLEYDVFLRDRFSGATERVSLGATGNEANDQSLDGSVASDGRLLAFSSYASNLVTGDGNGLPDVFLRDRVALTTVLLSVDPAGVQGNGASISPRISADGRVVAFRSDASNLAAGDTNGGADVFVRDLVAGTIELVSVALGGVAGNFPSYLLALSADGRFVVFQSGATDLVAGDANGVNDVFLRDRQNGTTERISVDPAGVEGNDHSMYGDVTPDGRFVAFGSLATNLVASDTNQQVDIFVRDRQSATVELVSIRTNGRQGNALSWYPSISADGRLVCFRSYATNLVAGDRNGSQDAFVHDRVTGITRRVSVDESGVEFDAETWGAVISPDGRFVTLSTAATNVVAGDSNGAEDAFLIGPPLFLSADPVEPSPGVTLALSTWTGLANGPAVLVVVDVNGAPTFVPHVLGTFDAAGRWALSTIVPSGLSGNVITIVAFGIAPDSEVAGTNAIELAFQ